MEAFNYIIALTVIVIVLVGAVFAHFSFGLHRVVKTEVEDSHAGTPDLDDLVFGKN